MKILAAIFILMIGEWIATPFIPIGISWQFALGAKYLVLSLLWIFALLSTTRERLIVRSIILLFCIDAWADLIIYMAWQGIGNSLDLSLQIFVIYIAFMIHILLREYDIHSDKPNAKNVTILLLKPKSHIELIKSFIGLPVSSVCIVAAGNVWSFRRKSGKYEKSRYNSSWLSNHIAIDTGIECEYATLEELNKIIGEDRYPYCKCVYSIRHVLNELGGKFAIKTRLDYIPGIYVARIINKKWG